MTPEHRTIQDWKQTYWRWLTDSALPLWAEKGVDHAQGGFEELLGLDGQPVAVPRRARVQGRQSFVFAYAGTLGWEGPWHGIAPIGLRYLESHYKRADGLYATLAGHDGAIIDQTAMTYDQAFALLAASALQRHGMGPGEGYALGLLDDIEASRSHPRGFSEAGGRFLSNPHMHLLEAALAWTEVSDNPRWTRLAQKIVTLALTKFIDPQSGALREFFDANWAPAPGDACLVTEPGHQFEWAWLLERWARARGDEAAHASALALFEAGLRGIDAARNVAIDETDPYGSPRRATARLWPQTERLKAALLLDRQSEARAAAQGLWQYLETPRPGLFRDKMRTDGTFVEEPAPASSLYHVICAVSSLRDYKGH